MSLTNFPNGVSVAGFAPPAGATITVGTEAANAILVSIQLTDGAGDALETAAGVWFYVSDDADGSSVAGTAPTTLAIGTDGLLIEVISNKAGLLVTESDGTADVSFGDAGGDTWYLVLVMPSGEIVVSGAITLAA